MSQFKQLMHILCLNRHTIDKSNSLESCLYGCVAISEFTLIQTHTHTEDFRFDNFIQYFVQRLNDVIVIHINPHWIHRNINSTITSVGVFCTHVFGSKLIGFSNIIYSVWYGIFYSNGFIFFQFLSMVKCRVENKNDKNYWKCYLVLFCVVVQINLGIK